MAALWLSGFEDDPEQLRAARSASSRSSATRSVRDAAVGRGRGRASRPSATPALTQDFAAPRRRRSTSTDFHTYAVDWDAAEAVFTVDDQEVRRCPRPPTYPLQLMLAVFDFPEWSTGDDDHLVPDAGLRRTASSQPAVADGRLVADRMSIRQPVSRAARRAFWPSLPIASDSWKSGTTTRADRGLGVDDLDRA